MKNKNRIDININNFPILEELSNSVKWEDNWVIEEEKLYTLYKELE